MSLSLPLVISTPTNGNKFQKLISCYMRKYYTVQNNLRYHFFLLVKLNSCTYQLNYLGNCKGNDCLWILPQLPFTLFSNSPIEFLDFLEYLSQVITRLTLLNF